MQANCYSVGDADYAILSYTIRYDGISQVKSSPLIDVYVGQLLDFDVSPGKDPLGRFVSDTPIYVYDSTNQGGVNIGARLLSGQPRRLGWWTIAEDPHSDSALCEMLTADTSCSVPGSAADHRVLLSSGPYSLDVGDTILFAIAIAAGNGAEAVLSASRLATKAYEEITPVRENENPNGEIPREFTLRQNYPNPFNPSTSISFDLPVNTHVKLCVYNILGQLVATLIDGEEFAGRYTVVWNAGSFASGVYFCRIESQAYTHITKMILMK